MQPDNDTLPRVPIVQRGTRIPRTIYQTYPAGPLPAAIADNIAYIRNLNPNHEYTLFDDEDISRFIRDEYGPEFLDYYDRINPRYGAARADLFRYLLIYKKGGVYLDIKSRMLEPLDRIIGDDQYLLSHWSDPDLAPHGELAGIAGSEFQNWHVIAVAGHPFLKAVIETVLRNIDGYRPWRHGVGKNAVLRVTGPIAYTLAIHPILGRYPHRVAPSEADLSLQYSIPVGGSHTRLFPAHYSTLDESVIRLTGPSAILARAYFRLRLHLLLRRLKRALKG